VSNEKNGVSAKSKIHEKKLKTFKLVANNEEKEH